MTALPPTQEQDLHYFLSADEPCHYIENQSSRMLVLNPELQVDEQTLSELSRHGFRRSGDIMYKPDCDSCHQCLSSRIPVHEFRMNSSQKKAWKRNQDLRFNIIPTVFANEQHFNLYARYIQQRHAEHRHEQPNPQEFQQFLIRSKNNSFFLELWLEQQLVAVSVCDYFDDGLSAVYTFFDPEQHRRSLGVFAILSQIEYAKSLQLDYVYLGYWVPHSNKMQYKSQYQPLEILYQDQWLRLKQPLSQEEMQRFG
ncbi:MAG: arginyltransferase, partial [Acinetobacter sp.]|nr:arginyltransferase [Acinetobacter sp.]